MCMCYTLFSAKSLKTAAWLDRHCLKGVNTAVAFPAGNARLVFCLLSFYIKFVPWKY